MSQSPGHVTSCHTANTPLLPTALWPALTSNPAGDRWLSWPGWPVAYQQKITNLSTNRA